MRIVKINIEGDFGDFITTHLLCAEDSAPSPLDVMNSLNTRFKNKDNTKFGLYKRDIEEQQVKKAFTDAGYVSVMSYNVNLYSDNIFLEPEL